MQARRTIEAPAASPLPFGLSSVAVVQPDADPHTALGLQYETLACGSAHLTLDQCVAELDAQPAWTTDDGRELVTADAFVIYALHQCRMLGGINSATEDALMRLANGYWRGVEEGVEQTQLADADDLTPTPGTAVHPVAGLAILEKFAAANYGSRPIIHMPRDVGTLVTQLGAVDRYGQRLETTQGALVASGAGYGHTLALGAVPDEGDPDDRVTAGDGTAWLRVTGTVVVHSGERHVTDPVQRRATTDDPEAGINQGDYLNEFQSFAHQHVVATTECINAAVLVQTPTAVFDTDGGTP